MGVKSYLGALAMAAGATVLALMIGAPVPSRTHLRSAAFALLPIVGLLTTFMFPSVLIAGVVTFYLLLGPVGSDIRAARADLATARRG